MNGSKKGEYGKDFMKITYLLGVFLKEMVNFILNFIQTTVCMN